MNTMKKVLIMLVGMMSIEAVAGSASNARPYQIHYMNDGTVIFSVTSGRVDVPECASGQPLRFSLNATTEGGKVQLTGLMTAYARKTPLTFVGTGTCSNGIELLNYFYTND